MPRVLHITAHLGGGVGSVLSSVACRSKLTASTYEHEIMQLEPTENAHFVNVCKKNDIPVCLAADENIKMKIKSADIVQVEWWHHPLTMKFMYDNLGENSCRLVIWSHISGCTYPCTPAGFVKLPEKFMFATPYSFENPSWGESELDEIRRCAEVVVSSSGNYEANLPKKTSHSGFNIGYVGFLGYSKTHPDFVRYCTAVDIPDAYFTVVGDTSFAGELMEDVKKSGMSDRFIFTGYSTNVALELATFDAFGCLLNPEHTGTAENALLEAMAAGVPPVVLRQCTEKYIVKDGKTGLVVGNIDEYANAMRYLYEHPSERVQIGKNAGRYVRGNYSIQNTVAGLEKVYGGVLNIPKRWHDIASVFGDNPYQWFCSCLGKEDNPALRSNLMLSQSKGSIYQYIKYFPDNDGLIQSLNKINACKY